MGLDPKFFEEYDKQKDCWGPDYWDMFKPWIDPAKAAATFDWPGWNKTVADNAAPGKIHRDPVAEALAGAERLMVASRQTGKTEMVLQEALDRVGLDFEKVLADFNEQRWSLTRELLKGYDGDGRRKQGRAVQQGHGAAQDPSGGAAPLGDRDGPLGAQPTQVGDGMGGDRRGGDSGGPVRCDGRSDGNHGPLHGGPGAARARQRRPAARRPHRLGRAQVSRTGIGWGFLACGFLAPGIALCTAQPNMGAGVALLAASLWCALLAFDQWQPPTGSGE